MIEECEICGKDASEHSKIVLSYSLFLCEEHYHLFTDIAERVLDGLQSNFEEYKKKKSDE